MASNDDLARALIGHAIDLHQYSAGVSLRIQELLKRLAEDLERQLVESKITGALGTFRTTRYKALLASVRRSITESYRDIEGLYSQQLYEFTRKEATSIAAILNAPFEAALFATTFNPTELRVLATQSIIQGSPSAAWWEGQAARMRTAFEQQMKLGIIAGETNPQLVQRVMGTATGGSASMIRAGKPATVPERTGGIMPIAKRDAEAVVRTGVQTAANKVLMATYKNNSELLSGLLWMSTLDNRTTLLCISRDHAAWDMDGNPLPDSPYQEEFPGPPPAHWGCRSVLAPIVKSWADLTREAGGDVEFAKTLDRIKPSTRASMDGSVPGKWSYEDWLKRQSKARQLEVLGPGRWAMWQKGSLPLARLSDASGRVLTLDQLHAK